MKRSLIQRLIKALDQGRTKVSGSAHPICWACSMKRCGQMFDNTCTCCRSHR